MAATQINNNDDMRTVKIKLTYNVDGNDFSFYLNKFDFDTIRDSNMYQNQERIFKNQSSPNPDTKFKDYLNNLDNKNYLFKIPLTSNYFNIANFTEFIKSKSKLEETSEHEKYEEYNRDFSQFFIVESTTNPDTQHISEYFNTLNNDLLVINKRNKKNIQNYETLKTLVNDYGKFILQNNGYINHMESYDYENIQGDNILLSKIITYHNIFQILKNFYLSSLRGCILKQKIHGNNSENIPVFIKITSLECILLNNENINEMFSSQTDELIPTYKITFETVPTNSNIEFHINLLNAIDIHKNKKIYKKYDNLFSKESNIIYIDKKINYSKINYSNTNNDNIKKNLMNNVLFNNLIKKNQVKSENDQLNMNDIISKYYIENIFFKKNSLLLINDVNVKIDRTVIHCLNEKTGIIKNCSDIQDKKNYTENKSLDIRLAIDNLNSTYITYLDLNVYYLKSHNEPVSMTTHLLARNNCMTNARSLDRSMGLINGFENLLRRNKSFSSNSTPKPVVRSDGKNDIRVGGKKTSTTKILRRNISTRMLNKTVKRLITFYAI